MPRPPRPWLGTLEHGALPTGRLLATRVAGLVGSGPLQLKMKCSANAQALRCPAGRAAPAENAPFFPSLLCVRTQLAAQLTGV